MPRAIIEGSGPACNAITLRRYAMKSVRRFAASAVLAAGMMAASPAVFAADPPPSQSQIVFDDAPPPAQDPGVRDAISAIDRAPHPSAAGEAYANAPAKDRVATK